jgi:hypothetical protein
MYIDLSWTTVGWLVVIAIGLGISGQLTSIRNDIRTIKMAVFAMHVEVDEFVHPDEPPVEREPH